MDKKLVHYLAPNIYRTPSEALQAFDYISKEAGFSGWDQFVIKYAGAGAMYILSKRLKKKWVPGFGFCRQKAKTGGKNLFMPVFARLNRQQPAKTGKNRITDN